MSQVSSYPCTTTETDGDAGGAHLTQVTSTQGPTWPDTLRRVVTVLKITTSLSFTLQHNLSQASDQTGKIISHRSTNRWVDTQYFEFPYIRQCELQTPRPDGREAHMYHSADGRQGSCTVPEGRLLVWASSRGQSGTSELHGEVASDSRYLTSGTVIAMTVNFPKLTTLCT